MSFSLKEIAEKAEVSPSTVSKVINNRSDVGEKTKLRVRKILQQMNYSPRPRKNTLHKKFEAQVNLIVMKNKSVELDPFYSRIVESITTTLQNHGMGSLYRTVEMIDSTQEDLREWLAGPSIQGTILIGASFDANFITKLSNIDSEVILVDNYFPGMHSVSIDNIGGAHQAVTHLIQCGCKRIAFLSGNLSHISIKERLVGYKECLSSNPTLAQAGIIHAKGLALEDGYSALSKMEVFPFDGLLCANDKLALGAIRALKKRGLRIPEDVSVVGFDNIEWAKHNEPPLTTIHIPKEQIGRMAAELLVTNRGCENLPVNIRIGTRLIVRASSLQN